MRSWWTMFVFIRGVLRRYHFSRRAGFPVLQKQCTIQHTGRNMWYGIVQTTLSKMTSTKTWRSFVLCCLFPTKPTIRHIMHAHRVVSHYYCALSYIVEPGRKIPVPRSRKPSDKPNQQHPAADTMATALGSGGGKRGVWWGLGFGVGGGCVLGGQVGVEVCGRTTRDVVERPIVM